MDEIAKHRLSKRCPVCFSREIDVLLVHETEDRYYCVKCGFRGSPSEIEAMYADIQKKFHGRRRRLTVEIQVSL